MPFKNNTFQKLDKHFTLYCMCMTKEILLNYSSGSSVRIKNLREMINMTKYENKDKKCECWKCELEITCPYKDKYQRLPRSRSGALGLCKKL